MTLQNLKQNSFDCVCYTQMFVICQRQIIQNFPLKALSGVLMTLDTLFALS